MISKILPRIPFKRLSPFCTKTFQPQLYKNEQLVLAGKEKLIGSWLLLSSGCVFFMIGLGGYTRLTKSGLSMTEWKPLSVEYPTNDEEWQKEFDTYKAFPEYDSHPIQMDRFKSIYFYEYFHRLVGRGIGN